MPQYYLCNSFAIAQFGFFGYNNYVKVTLAKGFRVFFQGCFAQREVIMEIKFKHKIPYGLVSSEQRKVVTETQYLQWVKDMVENHHCNISIQEIMRKLHVSDFWIRKYIAPAVDFVRLNEDAVDLYNLNKGSTVFYDEGMLREFLKNSATFSKQTVVIDLAKVLNMDLLAKRTDKRVIKFDEGNKHIYGLRSNRFLNLVNFEYSNVNQQKRSRYAAIKVNPFDFWERRLITTDEYPNNEIAYRDFFRKGMIKINLLNKSLFVEDRVEAEYPMTISYEEYLINNQKSFVKV